MRRLRPLLYRTFIIIIDTKDKRVPIREFPSNTFSIDTIIILGNILKLVKDTNLGP